MTTIALPQQTPSAKTYATPPRLLILAVAAVPLLTWLTPSEIPGHHRFLAALLWELCLIPAWLYFSIPPARRRPIPFLPFIGALYLFYYPLQVVFGKSGANIVLRLGEVLDYGPAVQFALAGWLALLVGYFMTGSGLRAKPFDVAPAVQRRLSSFRRGGLFLLYGGMIGEALNRTGRVPVTLRGLTYFATLVALLGVALLTILAVRRALTPRSRVAFYVGFGLLAVLRATGGTTATAAILFIFVALAFWVGTGRVKTSWLIGAVICLSGLVALRGMVWEFRTKAWFVDRPLTFTEELGLWHNIVNEKVQARGVVGAVTDGWGMVAGRSANLDLLADVVRQTPMTVPYWNGETYLSLVGFAIPRFLWPGKPTKRLGQEFGHRYGYLHQVDRSTSINLPYLVEFYANFGEVGLVVGMLLVGVLYRLLESLVNRPGQSLASTVCGLVVLVPMFNIESDFSLVFGGLFLNGVALWGLLRVLERLELRRLRRLARKERLRLGLLPVPGP